MRLYKFAILCVAAILLLRTVVCERNIVQSFSPSLIHRKDFLQDFLMAKAVVTGVDPYAPISFLKSQFISHEPTKVFLHPSPHPPSAILLYLPFANMPYETAALIWLACSVVLVGVLSAQSALFATGSIAVLPTLFIALILFSSGPVYVDLMSGQVHVLLTALLFAFVIDMRAGKDTRGGIWLGLCLSLKYFGWPIAIYLITRRKWSTVLSMSVVVLASHLVAFLIIGLQSFQRYFLLISPAVFRQYLDHEQNQSLWALAQRIFGGAWYLPDIGVRALPLLDAPLLVPIAGMTFVLIAVGEALSVSKRINSESVALGILIAVSFLVTPIAWMHTGVVTVIPLAFIAGVVLSQGNRSLKWLFAVLLLCWHTGNFPFLIVPDKNSFVPFLTGVTSLLPLLTVTATAFLLGKTAFLLKHDPKV